MFVSVLFRYHEEIKEAYTYAKPVRRRFKRSNPAGFFYASYRLGWGKPETPYNEAHTAERTSKDSRAGWGPVRGPKESSLLILPEANDHKRNSELNGERVRSRFQSHDF